MAGRPKNPKTNYKVALHKCGSYRYAATQPILPDPSTGKNSRRYIYWGNVTEDLRFIPNQRYLLSSKEIRDKLIFPSEWDMSEVQKEFRSVCTDETVSDQNCFMSDEVSAFGGTVDVDPVYDQFNNRFYGGTWLLWQIAVKKHVIEDLYEVFGSQTVVNDILTLAMFPILSNLNYSQTERWQRYTMTPSTHPLNPSAITRLTEFIQDDHRMHFLRLRINRQASGAVVACDSTSRSAYGRCLADIRWGNNKDNVSLQNTLEVVVYSLDTHEPIYYRTFAGNESDLRTLRTIISDLKALSGEDLMIIFDRGYESKENIENMIRSSQPFLVCGKTGQEPVYNSILDITYDEQGLPEGMKYSKEYDLYSCQKTVERDVLMNPEDPTSKMSVQTKINLFLNIRERMRKLIEIREEITREKDILTGYQNIRISESQLSDLKKECHYHKLSIDKNTEMLKVSVKEDVITKQRAIAGYFSSVSYKVEGDAIEQYRLYILRDEQEKYFEGMKDQLGFKMQRNWREDTKTGRLFILFIGLILHCEIRRVWKTELKEKYPSSIDVLQEMTPIRYVEYDDGTSHITGFTSGQAEIATAFKAPIPKECLSDTQKTGIKRKEAGTKRGRPKGSVNRKKIKVEY